MIKYIRFKIKKSIKFLIYSNLWISFCVGIFTLMGPLIQHSTASTAYILLMFFATLGLYNLHRLIGLKFTNGNNINTDRFRWAFKNKKMVEILTGLSFLIVFALFLIIPLKTIFYTLPGGIIALLYILPIFKNDSGERLRLRDLPYVKIFAIAFAFVYLTYFNHLIIINIAPKAMIFFGIFLFVIAVSIPFDIRDYKIDFEEGLLTFPTAAGIPKSKIFSLLVLSFSFLIFFQEGLEATTLGISYTYTAFMILKSTENSSEIFYGLFVEGSLIVIPLIYIVMSL